MKLLWKIKDKIEDDLLQWSIHLIMVFVLMTMGGLWRHHYNNLHGTIQELTGLKIQHEASLMTKGSDCGRKIHER